MDEQQIQDAENKIKKETEEIIQKNNAEELIKDNKIEFTYKDIKYRVKKASFEQKQIVGRERMKKYVSMLKNPDFLLESDLIKLYEQRGISIKELDNRFAILKKSKDDYSLKLGAALAESKDEKELEVYRKEIETIVAEQNEIVLRKTILLESSIEAQLNVFVYTYLASLITEKFETGWILSWNSYDDFIKMEDGLVNTVTWYSTLINRDESF
jgi:hypothetical protein